MLITLDAPADLSYLPDLEMDSVPRSPADIANSTTSTLAPGVLIVSPGLSPPSPLSPMPTWGGRVSPVNRSIRVEPLEDEPWPTDGLLCRGSPMSGKQYLERLTGHWLNGCSFKTFRR